MGPRASPTPGACSSHTAPLRGQVPCAGHRLPHKLPLRQQGVPGAGELEDLHGVALGGAQAPHWGLGGQNHLLLCVPWGGGGEGDRGRACVQAHVCSWPCTLRSGEGLQPLNLKRFPTTASSRRLRQKPTQAFSEGRQCHVRSSAQRLPPSDGRPGVQGTRGSEEKQQGVGRDPLGVQTTARGALSELCYPLRRPRDEPMDSGIKLETTKKKS